MLMWQQAASDECFEASTENDSGSSPTIKSKRAGFWFVYFYHNYHELKGKKLLKMIIWGYS